LFIDAFEHLRLAQRNRTDVYKLLNRYGIDAGLHKATSDE
jgi:hypothetical protein